MSVILLTLAPLGVLINNVMYKVHRICWKMGRRSEPPALIDHKDGDHTFNAYDNLREGNSDTNAINKGMRSDNTSGHIRVTSWVEKKTGIIYWKGQIKRKDQFACKTFPYTDEGLKLAIDWRKNKEIEMFNEYSRRYGDAN